MSVRALIQAAVATQLRGSVDFGGIAVFDAPPARAATPFVQIEEPALADWSTKSWRGYEARLAVSVRDAGDAGGDRPARLRDLADAAEAAVLSLPGELADGWRVGSLVLARSRVARSGDRWTATSEFRLRMYRAGE